MKRQEQLYFSLKDQSILTIYSELYVKYNSIIIETERMNINQLQTIYKPVTSSIFPSVKTTVLFIIYT